MDQVRGPKIKDMLEVSGIPSHIRWVAGGLSHKHSMSQLRYFHVFSRKYFRGNILIRVV